MVSTIGLGKTCISAIPGLVCVLGNHVTFDNADCQKRYKFLLENCEFRFIIIFKT